MKQCILALALFVCPAIIAQTYTPTSNVAMLTSSDGGATWESAGTPLDGSPTYVPTVYAAALCQSAPGQPWQLCSFSGGGGGAVNSVSNSDGTLTITPTTGSVVAKLNLGHANTWTATQTFTSPLDINGTSLAQLNLQISGTLKASLVYSPGTLTLSPTTSGDTLLLNSAGPVSIDATQTTIDSPLRLSNGLYVSQPCLGTDSSGNVQAGTCSGGGSLPTATQPGQIISSTAAGTTYAVQGQVFYNQTGDTISSIESECSSACTYVVTVPQTITLAASHTLSSNVNLLFLQGGEWTVNGAFTLTIPGNIQGSLSQHFAGTSTIAFGTAQALAPVEWFGAVGDWNGSTGTDNTTAIQACLNAMTAGQCQLQAQAYETTAALTIAKSMVGITGIGPNLDEPSLYTDPSQSIIISTSASADILDVGTTSFFISGNRFTHFVLQRSQAPTNSSAGLSLTRSYGAVVDGVGSEDSGRDFYFNGVGANGSGYIANTFAQHGFNGFKETTGTLVGYYLDGSTRQNPSLRMRHYFYSENALSGPTTYGTYDIGPYNNDLMSEQFETDSGTYPIYITGGTGVAYGAQDIHFTDPILNLCLSTCVYITNVPSSEHSQIEFHGGFIIPAVNGGGIYINNSTGITVSSVQIDGSSGAINAINPNSSSNLSFVGNNIENQTGDGIVIVGGSNIAVAGNTITGNSVARALIRLTSSPSYVSITGNTLSGTGTYGISVESGSSNVFGLETNSINPTLTTPINSAIPYLIPPKGSETVASSATPTFSNLTKQSYNVLTANVTSFTLAAGADGQPKTLTFCQNATGNFTVTAPANVHGFMTVGATASKCSSQHFTYSASQTAWLADSPGVTNE